MQTQKVNEDCDLGVDFDDTFKVDNHILSILSRAKKKNDSSNG